MERDDWYLFWYLFERYAAGECTAEEGARMERILAAPRGRLVFSEIRRAVDLHAGNAASPDVVALYEQLQSRIGARRVPRRFKTSQLGRLRTIGPWLAAGLVVGTIALVAGVHRPAPSVDGPIDGRSYSAATGQPLTVTLTDGTHVTLAPQSTLVLARHFGTTSRAVQLDGQAYFSVVATTGTPFVVRTGTTTTQVLGTTFGVHRYVNDAATRVTVISGKVAVRAVHARMTLTAHTAGQITDSTATTVAARAIDADTAWQSGRLIFDGTPVPEMLATLGRWYGYDFRLGDPALARKLAGIHVKAEFRAGAPSETLLMLRNVLDVTLTMDGSVITLHPPSTNRATPGLHNRRETLSTSTEVGK